MKKTNAHCEKFQKQLSKLKVDGYWVTHIPDLFYLSGYGGEGCWGLFGKKEAAMLVPMLAVDSAGDLLVRKALRSPRSKNCPKCMGHGC